MLGLVPGWRLDNYLFMGLGLPGCELVLRQVGRVTAGKSPVHFDIAGSNEEDFDMILARTLRRGRSVELRCGMASAAGFLASLADEAYPQRYVEEAERSDGTPMTARARQVVSQTGHRVAESWIR